MQSAPFNPSLGRDALLTAGEVAEAATSLVTEKGASGVN